MPSKIPSKNSRAKNNGIRRNPGSSVRTMEPPRIISVRFEEKNKRAEYKNKKIKKNGEKTKVIDDDDGLRRLIFTAK